METKEFIYDQHQKHLDYLNRLEFYTEEIAILKERLSEVTAKNTDKEVLKQVEHFQNQFIIQRNNIDELKHTIKIQKNELQMQVAKNPTAVDHRKVIVDDKNQDFIRYFEQNFNELRKEFNLFLRDWM
ncbi:MAG: hypothetical protein EBS34_10990 [Flavobacteriales bacterium]|nr:hypothetical protein [Flavobacteriales bacterium]